MWEKTTAVVVMFFIFYYNEWNSYNLVLVKTHPSMQVTTCRRLQSCLILWHPLEGTSTPWSRLRAPNRMELQPPDLISQLPLERSFKFFTEGSYPYHLCGSHFINLSYWIHLLQNITTCRPCFIKFSDWNHYQHLCPMPNIKTKTDHWKNHSIIQPTESTNHWNSTHTTYFQTTKVLRSLKLEHQYQT